MVYKNFNIGTAKPSTEELSKVKHHLIDILDPHKKYSVVDFQSSASKIITELNNKCKIPIVAGGTGLYIQALVEGYKFNDCNQKSIQSMYKDTGELIYNVEIVGLTLERQMLYNRINARTQKMFADGLVDEVKGLLKHGVDRNSQAMLGIGYKETIEYLDGQLSLDETVNKISQATRNFAKRQLSYFRNDKNIIPLDSFDKKALEDISEGRVKEYDSVEQMIKEIEDDPEEDNQQ